jgi:hypothetical protein
MMNARLCYRVILLFSGNVCRDFNPTPFLIFCRCPLYLQIIYFISNRYSITHICFYKVEMSAAFGSADNGYVPA